MVVFVFSYRFVLWRLPDDCRIHSLCVVLCSLNILFACALILCTLTYRLPQQPHSNGLSIVLVPCETINVARVATCCSSNHSAYSDRTGSDTSGEPGTNCGAGSCFIWISSLQLLDLLNSSSSNHVLRSACDGWDRSLVTAVFDNHASRWYISSSPFWWQVALAQRDVRRDWIFHCWQGYTLTSVVAGPRVFCVWCPLVACCSCVGVFLFLSWLVSLKPWMIFLVTRAPKHCPGHVLRPYRHFTWRCTKYVQILSQYQHVAPLLLFFFRTDHCTKTHLLTTSGVLRCLEPFLSPFRSARNVAKGWPLRVL